MEPLSRPHGYFLRKYGVAHITMVRMSEIQALNVQAGDTIGGYTLIDRLGGGAMGSVWKVKDDGGQLHAMKILRDSLEDDRNTKDHVTSRERLRREAMALRKIHNPGVCGIDDMELDDSVAFIVTELIEGENLRDDVAHNGKYVGEDLERLASKLIAAVQAVHAAGIIHRDIKPTNVMISTSGPILVDFGIAMGQGESHVTSTGLVMGTPGFIAPEIIDGAESDEMTDWWSVASVLAFAATGAPVFGSSPMMAVLEREASGNANLAGLPPRTLAAFRSALSPNRSKRCTPQELLNAITKDAWNKDVWDRPDSDMMLPFGKSEPDGTSENSTDRSGERQHTRFPNARLAWRARDRRTMALKTPPPPPPSQTLRATPALDSATVPLMNTVAEPHESMIQATQVMGDTMPVQPGRMVSSSPQAAVSDSHTVPMAERQAIPQSGHAAPVTERPSAPEYAASHEYTTEYTAPVQPVQSVRPEAPEYTIPEHPAPDYPAPEYRDPRSLYVQRSMPVILTLALPLMILAAAYPITSCLVAGALMIIASAIGINIVAQSQRETRRGAAKASDMLLRILSFPVHLLRGFIEVLPALAIGLVVNVCLVVIMVVLLHAPLTFATANLFGSLLRIPVPYGSPWSWGGLSLAVASAAAWIIGCYCPHTAMLRMGLGSLRGKERNGENQANTLASATLGIAIVAILVPPVMLFMAHGIDWWPWIL